MRREKIQGTQRKTLGAKRESTANITYMWHWARMKPRPQPTLVGGEHSHHYANPASSVELQCLQKSDNNLAIKKNALKARKKCRTYIMSCIHFLTRLISTSASAAIL